MVGVMNLSASPDDLEQTKPSFPSKQFNSRLSVPQLGPSTSCAVFDLLFVFRACGNVFDIVTKVCTKSLGFKFRQGKEIF